jgi:hypothetical protein
MLCLGGGGAESISEMPSKDNKQRYLDTIYKSETSSLQHLSEVQQAFDKLKTSPPEEHFSNIQQAFLTVSTVDEKDAYLLMDLDCKKQEIIECSFVSEIDASLLAAEDFIPEPINEFALDNMSEGKIKHEWIQKSILEVQGLIKENTFSLTETPNEMTKLPLPNLSTKLKSNLMGH